jgi:hypothetical protein
MLIPTKITTIYPAPLEKRSKRKAVTYDDRWMLYSYPVVWFLVLLAVAVLIWAFQFFAVPFFTHA